MISFENYKNKKEKSEKLKEIYEKDVDFFNTDIAVEAAIAAANDVEGSSDAVRSHKCNLIIQEIRQMFDFFQKQYGKSDEEFTDQLGLFLFLCTCKRDINYIYGKDVDFDIEHVSKESLFKVTVSLEKEIILKCNLKYDI